MSFVQPGPDSNIDNSKTKKAKGEQSDRTDKLMLKPRRLLSNGKTGGKNDENLVSPSTDVSTNELISIMSDNMKTMFENLNRKVDSMASDIENRLSKKFSQMIDKRISSEV